jgi:hypothetical protein
VSEDYFDVAWINHSKGILHGNRADGTTVERELTVRERDQLWTLNAKQEREMQNFLRGLAA